MMGAELLSGVYPKKIQVSEWTQVSCPNWQIIWSNVVSDKKKLWLLIERKTYFCFKFVFVHSTLSANKGILDF